MLEIERRFLLKSLPDLGGLHSLTIEDRMILTGEEHPSLRLRRRGEERELTKKRPKAGGNGTEMTEETITLSVVEYDALAKLDSLGQTKTRYYLPLGNLEAELDLWTGDLYGLGILEVEFASTEEAAGFIPPDFCGAEITGSEFEWLAGGKIAGKKFADLADKLSLLGYQQLSY